jgi:hypothetical protein
MKLLRGKEVLNPPVSNGSFVGGTFFTQKGLLKESCLPEAKSRLSETEKRTAIRKAPSEGKTVTHRRQPNKAK